MGRFDPSSPKLGWETLLAEIRNRPTCAEAAKISQSFIAKPDLGLDDRRNSRNTSAGGRHLHFSSGTKMRTSRGNWGFRAG
jgi:hypothetical protein